MQSRLAPEIRQVQADLTLARQVAVDDDETSVGAALVGPAPEHGDLGRALEPPEHALAGEQGMAALETVHAADEVGEIEERRVAVSRPRAHHVQTAPVPELVAHRELHA